MFKFLHNLFRRQPKRAIFKYWDGQRTRYADPIDAFMKMETHVRYRRDMHPAMVDNGDEEATAVICEAICDVFGVKQLNSETGKGLTIAEMLTLHGDFFRYLDRLKKNTSGSPTSPNSTPASTSSGSNGTTTSGTAPSGSTKNAAESAGPISSGKL